MLNRTTESWRRAFIRSTLSLCLLSTSGLSARADGDYQLGRGYDAGPLNFAGYADLDLQIPQQEKTSLFLNDLSLFITGHFGRLFNPFTEAELTGVELLNQHPSDARNGAADVVLERLYNDSYFGDSITVRVGKMLSPVGEWNVIHAAPLVLSAVRPAVTYRNFSEYATGASLIYSDPAGILPEVQIYWQPGGELSERPLRLTFHQYRDVEGMHINFGFGLLDQLGFSFQHSKDVTGPDQSLFGADYHYTAGKMTLQGEVTFSDISESAALHIRDTEWAGYIAESYAVDEHWSVYTWYEAFMDRSSTSTSQDLLFGVSYHFQPALVAKLEYLQNIGGQPVNRTGVFASWSVLF
jgi:hypothetical protein